MTRLLEDGFALLGESDSGQTSDKKDDPLNILVTTSLVVRCMHVELFQNPYGVATVTPDPNFILNR